METLADTKVINQMLEIEKNACQIIEEAKEKGNILIAEARKEAKGIIESTKKELNLNSHLLEKKLLKEAEIKINHIRAEKQNILKMLDKQTTLKKELAIKKISHFLFKQVLDDLC